MSDSYIELIDVGEFIDDDGYCYYCYVALNKNGVLIIAPTVMEKSKLKLTGDRVSKGIYNWYFARQIIQPLARGNKVYYVKT